MSLNELLCDNVNLVVFQSCAIECGLILKHLLQELDRLYRTKLLDHSFNNFGVSNATIYESNFHCVISIYLSPVPCLGVMRPVRDERTWRWWIIGCRELFGLL